MTDSLEELIDETPKEDFAGALLFALDTARLWSGRKEMVAGPNGLSLFLNNVSNKVPYYRRWFQKNCAREPVKEVDLPSFPIVTRTEMAARRSEFIFDDYADDSRSFSALTNGTIATQLKVAFDPISWYDLNYGLYESLPSEVTSFSNGVNPGTESVYFITDSRHKRTSVILPSLRANVLRRLIIGRSADEDKAVIKLLQSRSILLLYGRPTDLLNLADLAERQNPSRQSIRPKAILVSGENLYKEDKVRLENWYQTPIFNAYVSTEGGLTGQDCGYHSGFHVPEDRIKVEILDTAGSIKEEGSGELLLTNKINWAHAFIRYKVGDWATLTKGRCACGYTGTTITHLSGRDVLEFQTSCGPVKPQQLESILCNFELKQFRVEQSGSADFLIKVILARPGEHYQLVKSLTKRLSEEFCNLRFTVLVPNSITEQGGKRRRYVSLNYS